MALTKKLTSSSVLSIVCMLKVDLDLESLVEGENGLRVMVVEDKDADG